MSRTFSPSAGVGGTVHGCTNLATSEELNVPLATRNPAALVTMEVENAFKSSNFEVSHFALTMPSKSVLAQAFFPDASSPIDTDKVPDAAVGTFAVSLETSASPAVVSDALSLALVARLQDVSERKPRRPPFCPFHHSALFLPAAALVKKETSRKRQKGKKHEIRRSQHANQRGRGFPRCSIGVRSQ
jgi:hypothetical protein